MKTLLAAVVVVSIGAVSGGTVVGQGFVPEDCELVFRPATSADRATGLISSWGMHLDPANGQPMWVSSIRLVPADSGSTDSLPRRVVTVEKPREHGYVMQINLTPEVPLVLDTSAVVECEQQACRIPEGRYRLVLTYSPKPFNKRKWHRQQSVCQASSPIIPLSEISLETVR